MQGGVFHLCSRSGGVCRTGRRFPRQGTQSLFIATPLLRALARTVGYGCHHSCFRASCKRGVICVLAHFVVRSALTNVKSLDLGGNMSVEVELQKAISRREELKQELEKLDQLVELLSWWKEAGASAPADSLVGRGASSGKGTPVSTSMNEGSESFAEPFATPAEVIREAVAVLAEHGRPLKRGQLLKELSGKGVRIGGSDKSKVLGTTLWRAKDKIVSIDGWGYWIKERPCPLAGYKPESDRLDDLL